MQSFVYPAELTPDEKDGGFVVSFVDFPEAITQGDEVAETLCDAANCLEEAVANRMAMELPLLSLQSQKGQYAIPLPALTAAKAALYLAVRDTCIPKVELANVCSVMKKRCVVFLIFAIPQNSRVLNRR